MKSDVSHLASHDKAGNEKASLIPGSYCGTIVHYIHVFMYQGVALSRGVYSSILTANSAN